jgi:hypothetical protein
MGFESQQPSAPAICADDGQVLMEWGLLWGLEHLLAQGYAQRAGTGAKKQAWCWPPTTSRYAVLGCIRDLWMCQEMLRYKSVLVHSIIQKEYQGNLKPQPMGTNSPKHGPELQLQHLLSGEGDINQANATCIVTSFPCMQASSILQHRLALLWSATRESPRIGISG